MLAQLYILYFGVGSLLGVGSSGGGSGPFLYAAAALALHYGALCADALRGAIDTVSGPLREAAASLGLTVTVELEMETRAATPYPKAVTIHGEATPAQKQQLQQYLEQTFAIPVQRQVWTP